MLTINKPIVTVTKVSHSEHNVKRVNSIKSKYKQQRQDSKPPTFALTYQGTYKTLMTNCGFSESVAIMIESSYAKLYTVSIEWVAGKLEEATKTGYVTAAFGLRVRTPLLAQTILGTKRTPKEAAAEGRSAGNALGQSWCLLNNRACSEFMEGVRKSKFRLDIKPGAHIHDAQYYLIRDNMECLQYINEHLPKAVSWQEDPLIQNEHIKMSGQLEVFFPNWNHGLDLPNNIPAEEITGMIKTHVTKLKKKGVL